MTRESLTRSGWKQRLFQLFILFVLLALGVVAVTMSRYKDFLNSGLQLPNGELHFPVGPGTSLNQLAYELEKRGVIEHPRFLILLGRELDMARRLQAGEYTLQQGMTPRALLELLVRGKVIQYQLTLIEGQTFREMVQRIQAHPVIDVTLAAHTDAEIMTRLGYPGIHPEGRFLPDTYRFPRGTTDLQFLERAYHAMSKLLEAEWEARAAELPLATQDEALVLASIIEKETGVAAERPAIAGVFIRRLRKNMRLQTDPTVIYGLGEKFDGNLRLRDLRTDTPYNTYTRHGLPPTPIAMPGADAIHAALHPEEGSSLYFVSKGDGSHYFSSTLEEHNLAVDKYQKGKRGIKLSNREAAP